MKRRAWGKMISRIKAGRTDIPEEVIVAIAVGSIEEDSRTS